MSVFEKVSKKLPHLMRPILYTTGMGMLGIYSLYSYRLRKKWDEKQIEIQKLEDQVNVIRNRLLDPDWLNATENKIINSSHNEDILYYELNSLLKPLFNPKLKSNDLESSHAVKDNTGNTSESTLSPQSSIVAKKSDVTLKVEF